MERFKVYSKVYFQCFGIDCVIVFRFILIRSMDLDMYNFIFVVGLSGYLYFFWEESYDQIKDMMYCIINGNVVMKVIVVNNGKYVCFVSYCEYICSIVFIRIQFFNLF